MKSIVLIGDEANASRFMDELTEYQTKAKHHFHINGQDLYIKYAADIDRVAKSQQSAIIVVNTTANKIPDSVVKYLPTLPSDHMRFYACRGEKALHFLQMLIRDLKSLPSPKNKWFSLFGMGKAENSGKRVLSLQIGNSKVAG